MQHTLILQQYYDSLWHNTHSFTQQLYDLFSASTIPEVPIIRNDIYLRQSLYKAVGDELTCASLLIRVMAYMEIWMWKCWHISHVVTINCYDDSVPY